MSLKGKSPADTYKDLLYVDNDNNGLNGTSRDVKSGNGVQSVAKISDRHFNLQPAENNTTLFTCKNKGGSDLLSVDSTNSYVKSNGTHVNTQYATFSVGASDSSGLSDDTHHSLPFQSGAYGSHPPTFGTGTDPATSFTTAEGNGTRASDLVPCLWYVTDNISIDSIKAIEGADTATGDTTRMHCYSFDFTSGSTSALTNGTLLAHNSDTSNSGSEQAYLSNFTIDSASVSSGKVIMAFFKSDSINSDYSVQMIVKYHIT